MPQYRYYYNPLCSKCRAGKALLDERGVDYTVKEYLNEPLEPAELQQLIQLLKNDPNPIVRTKEDTFKALDIRLDTLGESEVVSLLQNQPKLLERPILVKDNADAVIGRPVERLNALL